MTHVTIVPLYAHEAEVINLALYRELRLLRNLPPVPPSGRERQRRQVSRSATCKAASAPTVLLGGSTGRGHGEPSEDSA